MKNTPMLLQVLSVLALLLIRDVSAETRTVDPPGDDAATLAGELSRLRRETESLAADLELKKQEHRSHLRALATQKADLELQLNKEQMQFKQLQQKVDTIKAKAEQARQKQQILCEPLYTAIRNVRDAVGTTLPFKTNERVAEVDGIEKQLKAGTLAPHDGLARLWDQVEDELRLAREHGVYKQVITLEGKEQLVDVARVGMVMLFFKTEDDTYGAARKSGQTWSYTRMNQKEAREQIASLFDAFKKQIRTGYFVIPNVLAGGGQ